MANTINNSLLEYVICYNVMFNIEYVPAIVDYYKPEYFENTDIRIVLTVVLGFFEKHNKLPNITEIKILLTNDAEKQAFCNVIQYFKTIDTKYNLDELYENTEQFLRERAVYYALLKTSDELTKNKTVDTQAVLDTFQHACSISLIDNLGFDYFEKITEHCDEMKKPNKVIPTGWRFLDTRIGGGLQAEGKALYVFTGFTNVGKSIFLGNLAKNIVLQKNKTVLLVSLEMSEQMYAKRFSSNFTQIPHNVIHNALDDLTQKLYEIKSEYNSKLIIKEFPTKGMTINHLSSWISKLLKKGIKPDVLIVDYLNLIKPTKHVNNNSGLYEDIKGIAEQLRGLTYQFNIPCVSASQLNRKGAGVTDPGMETTSESIGLSFTADGQFSIWSNDEDKKLGIIHMGIQKNRFGTNSGNTHMKIIYDTLTIEEMPESFTITDENITSVDNTLADLNKAIGP